MAKKLKNKDERTSNIPVKKKEENTGAKVVTYKENMTVGDFANELNVGLSEVVKKLMMAGIMASVNQVVDRETYELVAMDFGYELVDEIVTDATRFDEIKVEDKEEELVKRPPVVTIMGHVDHGKTTLLDTIRHTRVTDGEAGGITQRIGAYQVKRNDEYITFIDTPGHEAFTEMRARGAKVTDITVLVVAADDGVMPQTEEAIVHAQAAKVPIIVAVNKMDKPGANPDKVMQGLTKYNLIPEEWGGDTIFVKVSALKGMGLNELLDMIQLTADMQNLRANPKRLATGTVIEARLDKSTGPTASVIVENGTLKNGDNIAIGNTWGKIRTMTDDLGRKREVALPSTPVEITGLNDVPQAGDKFMVVFSIDEARKISEARTTRTIEAKDKKTRITSLDDINKAYMDGEAKELNLIVKADMQGSVEAIRQSLEKLDVNGIKVNVIRASVGAITDTDVTLADASNAIIIGFNVRPSGIVREAAKSVGVEIRLYNIIYKLLEEIEDALKGMLDPEYEEVVTGSAEVRNLFKVSKIGTIAGCYVTDGVIQKDSLVRIIRDGIVVYEGKMASLKRFKDDAKEVKQGFECGITIENYNDIKEGDIFEASVSKLKER
ncbi:MAG: translation initiation factor IF-2 [Acholeplasmatales bacterium]|nr:translation initiation factor IF-2 [Acholeplasmatales bacterium]